MDSDSWINRLLRWARMFLASIGFLLLLVTFTPIVGWWGKELAGSWSDPKGEILIVLGGSSFSDGIMGQNSYLRSIYALLAYQQDGFQQLILSGGGAPVPISQQMKTFLQCQGVPEGIIRTEAKSKSTRENALYTKAVLTPGGPSIVLLTSDYHMFRAHRAFKKAGIDVLPRPIPDVCKRATSPLARWSTFVDLVQESSKIVYYWLRGWI